jgi:hypothetical protein
LFQFIFWQLIFLAAIFLTNKIDFLEVDIFGRYFLANKIDFFDMNFLANKIVFLA